MRDDMSGSSQSPVESAHNSSGKSVAWSRGASQRFGVCASGDGGDDEEEEEEEEEEGVPLEDSLDESDRWSC